MAKTPRPSIADQLAGIAATRPRDDAATLPRHHVAVPEEPDASPPPAAAPAPDSAPRDHVATSSRRSVSTRKRENETPDGMKVRQRVERHLQLERAVQVVAPQQEALVAELHAPQGVEAGEEEAARQPAAGGRAHPPAQHQLHPALDGQVLLGVDARPAVALFFFCCRSARAKRKR